MSPVGRELTCKLGRDRAFGPSSVAPHRNSMNRIDFPSRNPATDPAMFGIGSVGDCRQLSPEKLRYGSSTFAPSNSR